MLFSSFKKEKEDLEDYKMNIKIYLSIILLIFINVKNLYSQISYKLNQDQENQIIVNYSNPKTYEISKIDVLGSKYLDKIALISISGLKIGDQIAIPGDAISGAIKKLWKHNKYRRKFGVPN